MSFVVHREPRSYFCDLCGQPGDDMHEVYVATEPGSCQSALVVVCRGCEARPIRDVIAVTASP